MTTLPFLFLHNFLATHSKPPPAPSANLFSLISSPRYSLFSHREDQFVFVLREKLRAEHYRFSPLPSFKAIQ